MKIRNSFVSNSSSTSFIICVKPTEKCPHCGRSSPNIVDLVEKNRAYSGDETQLEWDDPQGYLNYLQEQIDELQQHLELYKYHKDDEIIQSGTTHKYTYVVGEEKQRINHEIDFLTNRRTAIQDAINIGKKPVCISISYHDTILNNILQEQIETGEVEVINNDEN